ncbi:hypothetical protein TUM19329_15250 [Legionella antarctica]|uniref:Uncharacterized protein n=1 Tax=Legionella antarctica TaxID=2708020 RepID=A0A6F8T3A2_9GAMM|nr:hypothetical protein [Legionella antarctica]BCA95164.1 hypothetical protein TUM19329_15250 [Legionella antarctica]
MQGLQKIGHKSPLNTFLALDPVKRKTLLNNTYYSFELIKFFSNNKYPDPLKTFLSIPASSLVLLLNNTYYTTEVMKALISRGKSDPISYLEKLGNDAFITIMSSPEEYTNRIKRGVNLEDEFLPPPVDNEFSTTLKAFIQFVQQKPENTSRLISLSISKSLLEQFKDDKTGTICNIPVRLDGDLFDLNTLESLTPNREGYRTNPLTNEQFLLSALQPAKDIQRNIEKLIQSTSSDKPVKELTNFAFN